LEDAKRTGLKGNSTSAILRKKDMLGKTWDAYSIEKQDAIVLQLLNEENKGTLIAWLMQHTGVDEQRASKIADVKLPDDYGKLSHHAVLLIMPHLSASVVTYAEVIKQLGFDSRFNAEGEILKELPYYGEVLRRAVGFATGTVTDPEDKRYGRIANPTVHIGLNQVRRVVNAIIKEYGHPSQIVVEVARELKQSKVHQKEITSKQAANQKRNRQYVDDACAVLQINPTSLSRASRRELSQKMQLWHELGTDPLVKLCPYTGKQISREMLLLGNSVQVEHILPYAQTLDDSMNNKTVALRSANHYKGDRTPHEAFGHSPAPYNYENILENAKKFHKDKRKRFLPNALALWLGDEGGGFIARALTDTAYIAKVAKEYLQFICPGAVTTIPGRMTALIRETLELNQLL
jgi:CRISPR-associated endonuclease Csn1